MLPKGGDRIWDIGADVCYNVTDPGDPFCKDKVAKGDNEDSTVPLVLLKGIEESRDGSRDGDDEDDEVESCDEDEVLFDIPQDDDGSINRTVEATAQKERLTTKEIFNFLREWGAGLGSALRYSKLYGKYGSVKATNTEKAEVEWQDTSITPLPYAPNLKIYCMYGVGLDSERSYFYKVNKAEKPTQTNESSESSRKQEVPDVELPFVLDMSVDDPGRKIRHGIRFTDGDGSVPLLSLGYVCADAWTRKDSGLNPSGTKVVTLEYKHQHEFVPDDPFRSGPRSADHVDILGNLAMTEDFLRIVSDFKPKTESNIVSNLREIAKAINENPKGGLFNRRKNWSSWHKWIAP